MSLDYPGKSNSLHVVRVDAGGFSFYFNVGYCGAVIRPERTRNILLNSWITSADSFRQTRSAELCILTAYYHSFELRKGKYLNARHS